MNSSMLWNYAQLLTEIPLLSIQFKMPPNTKYLSTFFATIYTKTYSETVVCVDFQIISPKITFELL